MPTQRPKTTETVNAKALRKYDYLLADRFSAVVSLNTIVKDKSSTRGHGLENDDFFFKILGWNPAWVLQKEGNSGIPPRAVANESISPIPLNFNNHRDYCEIMEPLLTLEFWEQISKAMEVEKTKVPKQAPMPCSTIRISRASTKERRSSYSRSQSPKSTVTLEGILSRKDYDSDNYPDCGDLVVIEQEARSKTEKPLQIFAYVEEMDANVTPSKRYIEDLFGYVGKPHVLLMYSLYVKPTKIWCIRSKENCTLRKMFNLRSNLRMIQGLRYLDRSPLSRQILHPKFEDLKLSEISSSQPRSLVTQDQLNSKQLEAVIHVTESSAYRPKIFLIQGPPGTGKSKVIVNLVTEILFGKNKNKMRILVCAPSNTAVDEVVRRLLHVRQKIPELTERFKIVRMGQKKSMDSQVAEEVSLKAVVAQKLDQIRDDFKKQTRTIMAKIKALNLELREANNAKDDSAVSQLEKVLCKCRLELRLVNCKERVVLREMLQENRAEISVLKEANVIACTLNSCYTSLMKLVFAAPSGREDGERVDFCIVDEATQCVEADCLIPLMLGVWKLVLVGDTNQLPATVISQRAKKLGLDQSLFARLQKCFPTKDENPVIQLDTQYRMPPPVALWPNLFFYDGLLQNAAIIEDLPFHHYKVFDHNARQNRDKFSNTNEAAFVVNLLITLMTHSQLNEAKTPVKVGIITPYNNQKTLIQKQILKCIDSSPEATKSKMLYEVNTVDGFQGQERDIIIMSCVRSNGIGFLSDRHRLCVALTRAKHTVILCGNFKNFETNSMWKALLSDAKSRGVYLKINATARPNEIRQHVFR